MTRKRIITIISIILFVFSFSVRFAVEAEINPDDKKNFQHFIDRTPDSYGYIVPAYYIKRDGQFKVGNDFSDKLRIEKSNFWKESKHSVARVPIYSFFLSLILPNFDCELNAINCLMFVQNIISSLTVVLIFLISTIFIKRIGYSLIPALTYIFNPISVQIASDILTETLFCFFFIISVLLYFLYIRERKYISIFLGSLLFVILAEFTRPVGLVLAGGFGFIEMLRVFKGLYQKNYKLSFNAIKMGITILLICGIPVGIWSYRNKQIIGDFQFEPTLAYNKVMYFCGQCDAEYTHRTFTDVCAQYNKELLIHSSKIGFDATAYKPTLSQKVMKSFYDEKSKKIPSVYFYKNFAMGFFKMFLTPIFGEKAIYVTRDILKNKCIRSELFGANSLVIIDIFLYLPFYFFNTLGFPCFVLLALFRKIKLNSYSIFILITTLVVALVASYAPVGRILLQSLPFNSMLAVLAFLEIAKIYKNYKEKRCN